MKSLRICLVPEYPPSLMTGGLLVQAEETCRALNALGGPVSAQLLAWSDRQAPADLYHFIGFPPYLAAIAELIRTVGKPYVVTPLFGCPEGTLRLRLAATRQFIRSRLLRQPQRLNALRAASAVVVITQAEAVAARVIFRLRKERIHVVPNGVDERFFHGSPIVWQKEHGDAPFVLCVGAIQERKNQLLLVSVCNRLQLPVVLLGPVLPGQAAYGQAVEAAMSANQRLGGLWLRSLRNDDELLVSAFAACRLFALLSVGETQPLSVMQAMAARKPVLLLRAPYARDALFSGLAFTESLEIALTAAALRQLWDHPRPSELAAHYTWREVALRLRAIYETIPTSSDHG